MLKYRDFLEFKTRAVSGFITLIKQASGHCQNFVFFLKFTQSKMSIRSLLNIEHHFKKQVDISILSDIHSLYESNSPGSVKK